MMLLAQSALFHGLSTVCRHLLEISGDTNEIYMLPVPESFMGKSFAEHGAAILQNRNPFHPHRRLHEERNPRQPSRARNDRIRKR